MGSQCHLLAGPGAGWHLQLTASPGGVCCCLLPHREGSVPRPGVHTPTEPQLAPAMAERSPALGWSGGGFFPPQRGDIVPRSQRHRPVASHTFRVLVSRFPSFVQDCCCSVAPTQDVRRWLGGRTGMRREVHPKPGPGRGDGPARSHAPAAKPEDLPHLLKHVERGKSRRFSLIPLMK